MHPNEMFECPPLFLQPETDPQFTSTGSLIHSYNDGSHFFQLLKPTPTERRVAIHQAPHGDSAHDFLVLGV